MHVKKRGSANHEDTQYEEDKSAKNYTLATDETQVARNQECANDIHHSGQREKYSNPESLQIVSIQVNGKRRLQKSEYYVKEDLWNKTEEEHWHLGEVKEGNFYWLNC